MNMPSYTDPCVEPNFAQKETELEETCHLIAAVPIQKQAENQLSRWNVDGLLWMVSLEIRLNVF